MKHWKIKLVAVILLICIVIGVFFCTKIKKITYEGNAFYSTEEIEQQLFTSFTDSNSITLYFKNKLLEHKTIPFIQEYNITWDSINSIHVQVYEKSVVACVKYMNTYVYFDKDGTILESSNQKKDNIPCFEGIKFNNFTMYQKLNIDNDKMLEKVLNLSQLMEHYKLDADKLNFNSRGEATLYKGKIKVNLGDKDRFDEEIGALSEILPIAIENDKQGQIDLSNYKVGDKIILKQKN